MKKDCAFQYYNGTKMVKDSGLITREQAYELWKEWGEDFVNQVEMGTGAEICIWTNMENDTDYQTDEFHLCADDLFIERGTVYEKVARGYVGNPSKLY
jgi:hypothetical protein